MRVMAFDATEPRLARLWDFGSMFHGFDLVIPARSWDDVFDRLPDFDALQVWSHGSSAAPAIDGKRMPTVEAATRFGARRLGRRSYVWFRSCSVFQGTDGQRFAAKVASLGDLRVVGHTRIVSQAFPTVLGEVAGAAFQSGAYGLRPGEQAHWPASDGGYSAPWKRNTCTILARNPSPTWFQPA